LFPLKERWLCESWYKSQGSTKFQVLAVREARIEKSIKSRLVLMMNGLASITIDQ
jgi:hypothetical protein